MFILPDRFIRFISAGVAGLLVALSLQGCVTSKKYRLAKTETAPAELNWSTSAPAAKLALKNLIVFKGSGSWKREARWDEYVVQLTNQSDRLLTVDSASLIDLVGAPQSPGVNPWKLEKLSYTNWEKYGKSGLKLLAGAGIVTIYAGAVIASATSDILAGGAEAGGGAAFLSVIPVVAVVDITVVAFVNHNNKAKVQAEFDRRRLALPLSVPPGTSITGSFFFPMTPGPQRLIVVGHTEGTPVQLTLDLAPFASLHLKTKR